MSSNCDKLRARALKEGLYSDAAQAWKAHAETCSGCRRELRIIHDLRDSPARNLHLKRDSLETLLQEVDQQGRHYRRRTPLRIAFQGVCLLALGLSAAVLYSAGLAIGAASRDGATVSVRHTLERVAADVLGDGEEGAFAIMEFTSAFAEEDAADEDLLPCADEIDGRIRALRTSLESERARVLRACGAEVDRAYWIHLGADAASPTSE